MAEVPATPINDASSPSAQTPANKKDGASAAASEGLSSTPLTVMPTVVVTGKTEQDRIATDPGTGTAVYTLNHDQIQDLGQGEDTSFNQVMTRFPGAAGDTYGAVHFRNEDPYYRYYINGTLLPLGINGFSQDLDTRFVDSTTLKIGALPAFYNQGVYGIIDIQTKTGAALDGGSASFYGGSYDTMHPSFTYGTSSHGTDFFATGSFLQNDLGLENPTGNSSAIHDQTQQYKGFFDLSHQFEDAGRLSFIFSSSTSSYEIPNIPGQTPLDFSEATNAPVPVDSTNLNERQYEQTYYGIFAYQQTVEDFSCQISQVNRFSSVLFSPDINGDLLYNGVAARVYQNIVTNGVQDDFTYQLNDEHTLRWGVLGETSQAVANNTVYVYGLDDATGNPMDPDQSIEDDHTIRAYDYAVYLQDEWKITDQLTLNYGGRFEQVKAYTDESQFSPRINAVYKIDEATSVHGGYARYFIAPPLESVAPTSVSKFDGTTNAADQDTDDPVKAERDHYFDVGVTHQVIPNLLMEVDTYYKIAKNQIDDGQFGAANISSPYNYGSATVYGATFSTTYKNGGFSAYGNFGVSDSWAKNIVSSQFEFDANELAYIQSHEVHLDQSQFYTASVGASYTWLDTTFHADALYGDGIRSGFVNTSKLNSYYPVNLGVEHRIKNLGPGDMVVRFDIENVFDQVYILNDGTGIGEGAIRYGNRRGFYGGVSYEF